MQGRLFVLLALLALAGCFRDQKKPVASVTSDGTAATRQVAIAPPIEGDYLTLVLSWSPTYCLSDAGKSDRQQCQARRSYAFVVHGLWPQYEKGWPDYCAGEKAPWIDDEVIDQAQEHMPSRRLIIHEGSVYKPCASMLCFL